jgi:hypothetical protein
MYPNAITEKMGKKSSTYKLESNTNPVSNIDLRNIEFSSFYIQTFIWSNAISIPLDRYSF